jgi:MoxR-like ATPase
VQDGDGQIALVSGEAGIGKTRLLQALAARIGSESGAILTCQCSPYFTNTAFFPFIDLVRRQLKLGTQPTEADVRVALEARLPRCTGGSRCVALIASMPQGPRLGSSRRFAAGSATIHKWLTEWMIGSDDR